MNHSLKTGFSFGLASGIVTTLGLMVGLHSGTHSKIVVVGGVLTIAVADACSDALGIHISEESELKHSAWEVWTATISTFLAKLASSLTFIIPIMLFKLSAAIFISVAYGLTLLGVLSFMIARAQKINPGKVIFEHLAVAMIVIGLTHYPGFCNRIYAGITPTSTIKSIRI